MNTLKKIAALGSVLGFGLLGFAGLASAAPLTYSTDTTLSLTSPSVNFIAKSGSTADSVTVNAGSVALTVSNGEVFTLTSASRDFSVVGAGPGITDVNSCSSGTATMIFTAQSGASAATFTVSPAASACTNISSGGGGGGSSSSVVTTLPAAAISSFVATPASVTPGQSSALSWTTTNATTVSISGLGNVTPVASGTLSVTPTQTTTYTLTASGTGGNATATATVTVAGTTPAPTTPAPTTPVTVTPPSTAPSNGNVVVVPVTFGFAGSLKVGMGRGAAIMSLQQFLNSQGFTVAKKGAGSPGHETKIFGSATMRALAKYQKSVHLRATGRLDKATVKYFLNLNP